MQDEVTERIVTTIANRMEKTEQDRVAGTRPEAMRAYDYVLRARAIIAETAEANQQARSLYEKALELEPNNTFIKQNYELFKEINDRTTRPDTQ